MLTMSQPQHSIPYRVWLLVFGLSLLALSLISPQDRFYCMLEHAATLLGLVALIIVERHHPLSNTSCTLLFIYLVLHIIGAHYLYSNVPYDQWSQWLLGVSINEVFGFQRNHYDRLVHFANGALLMLPLVEVVQRWITPGRIAAAFVAFTTIMTIGVLYELMEWGLAMIMDPENAELFNGQQGDMFDAQKDLALACLGASLSGLVIVANRKRAAAFSNHNNRAVTASAG